MLRITGGAWNGRILKAPPAGRGGQHSTRPTQARLRQALFNSVQFRIQGARVLDLFAGSGALGFEALSRGAVHVTFVEGAHAAQKCIEANAEMLGLVDAIAHLAPVMLSPPLPSARGLAHQLEKLAAGGEFDLILIDPPYAEGWELPLLEFAPWEKLLKAGGLICFEWGARKSQVKELPEKVGALVKVREKIYGESILTTFERES